MNLSAKLSATSGSDLALEWDAAQRLAQRLPDFAAPSEFKLQNEFRCVGVRLADTPRPLSVSAKSNELVGRETELGILASALERLSQGDGRLIVLSGQRGIGKSRLLEAFRNSFVPARNAIWLRSDPRDAAEYMSFWRDLTGSLALVLSDGRADGLARSLTIALSAAEIPADLHAVVEDVMPASGLLHTERLAALEGISRRELLERAILAIAIAAAKKKPTLICLDDAQWIDEASCRLLAELLPLAPELLVVLAHRDGDYPHLDRLKRPVDLARTTMIALGPLGSLEIARISRNAGAGERHPDADFGQIFELSGGNPFYAEQIAHWLEGSADNSVSTLARTYTGPKSLDRVLDERLDSLSPPESRIVRTLSIFDRPLSVTALNALASAIPVRAMAEALTSLTTNAFVKFADAGGQRPTAGLTINHRLLADAVIAHIPPSEAQLLHASAARFFGRLRAAKEDPSVTDALIAHHWNEAGEARRAALKLGKAGDAVLYAGAPELAIEHFNKALKLIANGAIGATPRVAGWYAGRAVAQWAKGEMAHALDDAAQALSLLDNRLGGPSWLPRAARAGLARLRRTVLAAAGLGLVPRAARPPLVVVSALRAEMAFFLGEVGTMASAYLSMMAFAHEPRLRARTRARAYLFLGHMATLRPFRFERAAHRAWDAARTLGESVGDSVAASHGYLGEAIWHMSFGRWSQARSQLHSAVELYGDVADPAYNKFVETLLALAANFEGDWRQAQQRFQGLLEVGQRQNNRSTQAWGLYGQVMALTAQARWLEANMLLALAEPIVDSMPDKQSQIICKGLRTQIEYGQARFAGAFERATDCLALAHSLTVNNFGSLEGFAAPAEIILRLSLDDRAPAEIRTAARRNIRRAMKSLERFAWAHPIAQPRLSLCRALAARLHERQSDWRRALHQGLDEARSYGMEFERLKLELERSRSDAPGATND